MTIPVNDGLLQIIDVKHGACALLTVPSPNGGYLRMMIDCGQSVANGFFPGKHLKKLNARRLDQLVITNYDEDHVSGFPDLVEENIDVGWLCRNRSVTPADIKRLKTEDGMGGGIDALVRRLESIDARPKGMAEILYPPQAPVLPGVEQMFFWNTYGVSQFEDENNLSLVMFLTIHGVTFLFPGDMECAGFENLLTRQDFRTWVAKTDVLIASHHGRANGICPDMFDRHRCIPELVVISDDYKQYATQETTNYFGSKALGIANFRGKPGRRLVLTTRDDGEILFKFQGGRCYVA